MNTTSLKPRVQIQEIAYTGYPVTDLARARKFYEELLGLKPASVWETDGKAWIEYEVGASTMAITNMSADQWHASKDGPTLALEVENFDEAVEALRAAGVVFYLEPLSTGLCQMAIIGDPDGNSLAIHKRGAK